MSLSDDDRYTVKEAYSEFKGRRPFPNGLRITVIIEIKYRPVQNILYLIRCCKVTVTLQTIF